MTTVRFHGRLDSVKVAGLPPGMIRYRLKRHARDAAGENWPAGSEFAPLCGGYDNDARQPYSEVVMVKQGRK
jgi:hypothetical protein